MVTLSDCGPQARRSEISSGAVMTHPSKVQLETETLGLQPDRRNISDTPGSRARSSGSAEGRSPRNRNGRTCRSREQLLLFLRFHLRRVGVLRVVSGDALQARTFPAFVDPMCGWLAALPAVKSCGDGVAGEVLGHRAFLSALRLVTA